ILAVEVETGKLGHHARAAMFLAASGMRQRSVGSY
ncbi:unnamed protein product, partial [marine sediment metagenome]